MGGSREPFGQPGRVQRLVWIAREAWQARESQEGHLTAREAPEARQAPGSLERAIWTAREGPETCLDGPGGLAGTREPGEPFRQPEAPESQLDSPGGTRRKPVLQGSRDLALHPEVWGYLI